MKFIKQKAIFMIFLTITLILFFPKTVSAQETQENVCCSQTKTGEICEFTSQDNCMPGAPSQPTPCEETNFCQLPGCCYNSLEGQCFKTTTEATCSSLPNSTWDPNPDCDIPECIKNCCILGEDCSLTTQKQCENKYLAYNPDLTIQWDIIFEEPKQQACEQICLDKQKGCCVKQDSQCTYSVRDICPTSGLEYTTRAGFFNSTLCSSIEVCGCIPKDHKACVGDNVYYFDSCNNQEELAEECNYDEGFICIEKDKDASCQSLNCETTADTPNIQYDNVPRKNGESWCDYDGRVGPSNDLIGSRHYRRMCINGQEIVEPCRDYREEYCIQGTLNLSTGSYSTADCTQNRWWDCSTTCNQAQPGKNYKKDIELDRQCCQNITERDCIWWGSGGSDPLISDKEIEETLKENSPGVKKKKCKETQRKEILCSAINPLDRDGDGIPNSQDDDNDNDGIKDCTTTYTEPGCDRDISPVMCYQDVELKIPCAEQASGKSKGGKCVPLVPPAFVFWQDPDPENTPTVGSGEDYCHIADQTCTVLWERKKSGGSCKTKGCIQNCHCLTDSWIRSTNEYCRAQGDCGAHYNVIGDLTTGGFYENAPGGPIEELIGEFKEWTDAGKGITYEEVDLSSLGQPGTLLNVVNAIGAVAGLVMAVSFLLSFAKILPALPPPVQIALIIIIVIILMINFLFGACPPKEKTYITRCSTWEQPTTNKCELCKQEYKICDEYRCKSLGQNCQIINREDPLAIDCVEVKPEDVNPPIISPDYNFEKIQNYTIQEFNSKNGFTILPKRPAYKSVKFGLLTNEPAKCKLHSNRTSSYDEMPSTYLGSPAYKQEHNISMQLKDNALYSYYVRCQDILKNKNIQEYQINFEIEKGPDLTPPVIEIVNPSSGSKIRSDIIELPVKIYIDEYLLFNETEEFTEAEEDDDSILTQEEGGCKWDYKELPYSEMQNNFICSSARDIDYNLFTCNTMLPNITETTSIFYFRCRDLAGNINQPYQYTITGSTDLEITYTQPEGILFTENLTLQAITINGADFGASECRYSTKDILFKNMVPMLNTNSTLHKQPLYSLRENKYSYYIKCQDSAKNEAQKTISFELKIDKKPPKVLEIFKDSVLLHLVLDEKSNCEYLNTSFNLGEGIPMIGKDIQEHLAPLQYPLYVNCQDLYYNQMKEIIIYPET